MPDIQLFSYPTSPFALKVSCYLKYKQLDFKFIPVNPLTNAEIAFTKQRQVPVLQIGDQWRKESSDLGLWLEEHYPDKPLLPTTESARQEILNVDKWISDALLPSVFRYAVEWQNSWYSIHNGWRLSRAVNSATPIPLYARIMWPFGIKRAPFIVQMVNQLDQSESIPDMNTRLQNEFIQRLGNGPYLANQEQPSLADFSAFPVIASGYFMGMKTQQSLIENTEILAWAKRVYEHLPNNPFLVSDRILKRIKLPN